VSHCNHRLGRWTFSRELVLEIGETVPMKKTAHHLIAEVPRSRSKAEMTIGIDLGDVWSHYCTLNEDGEVGVGPSQGRPKTGSIDFSF
jgi:hypothetical protein